MPVATDDLLADLRRVATTLGTSVVAQREYNRLGTYSSSTLARRFGTWNKALEVAGLSISNEVNIPDDRLFENLLNLWQHYGRQPRRAELAKPPSAISQGPYKRRFRTWKEALTSFVSYANAGDIPALPPSGLVSAKTSNDTGRDPSLRLRWRVLHRDNFKCVACGAAPAITPGVELHVDHVTPWSKGGSTVIENLQTLCVRCNLGKSNE